MLVESLTIPLSNKKVQDEFVVQTTHVRLQDKMD